MIKAVGADSGNDPLSISGVSYFTHANKQATSFTHSASATCRPVDRLLLTTHLYKVPCISATLVSAGPALLVSLVWGLNDKFKCRLLRGPVGVKYPKLAQHVSHFSSCLLAVSDVIHSASVQANTGTYRGSLPISTCPFLPAAVSVQLCGRYIIVCRKKNIVGFAKGDRFH